MKIKLSAFLLLILSIILTACGSEEAGKAEKQESTETTKTAEMKELSPTEVVDNIQLETDVLASDQISGEVRPGVKSSGIIAFKPPRGQSLDVTSVKTVNFYLGTIYPEDLTKSKTKEIEFAVYIK